MENLGSNRTGSEIALQEVKVVTTTLCWIDLPCSYRHEAVSSLPFFPPAFHRAERRIANIEPSVKIHIFLEILAFPLTLNPPETDSLTTRVMPSEEKQTKNKTTSVPVK